MERIDDLKVEFSEDGNCRITFTTAADMGFLINELIEDGHFIKNKIEEMILKKFNDYYQICPYDYDDTYDDEYWSSLIDSNELDGYLEIRRDCEIIENDKRVIEQYYENYYQLFERIRKREHSLINYETEEMSSFDYEYLDWLYGDENLFYKLQEKEIIENDKRVIYQYDKYYFQYLEWIKYWEYIGDPNMRLSFSQVERLWKLNNIRKIMKEK